MSTTPEPFACPEIHALEKALYAAQQLAAAGKVWSEKLKAAEARLASAADAFVRSPVDDTDFFNAAQEATRLKAAVAAVGDNGGPDHLSRESLRTRENFDAFARAFAGREAALAELIEAARKPLAPKVGELVASGVDPAAVVAHPEFTALRRKVTVLESVKHAALVYRLYAEKWTPADRERSFGELFAALTAPLPA